MHQRVHFPEVLLDPSALFGKVARLIRFENAVYAVAERLEEAVVAAFDGLLVRLEDVLGQFEAQFVVVVDQHDDAEDPEHGSVESAGF